MCGSFSLTSDLSIKIELLHALLAVSMPNILLQAKRETANLATE